MSDGRTPSDPQHRPDDAPGQETGRTGAVESSATAGRPTAPESATTAESSAAGGSSASRKRRLAEVFGDVLPETTSDERPNHEASNDERLRRDVPPHHA